MPVDGSFSCCYSVHNSAQQRSIGVATPHRGLGGGSYEQTNVGWAAGQGGPGGGWYFNSGGPGPLPPFGAAGPAPAMQFGGGDPNGGFRWSLGITADQGSSQSLSSWNPSVTLPNGGRGFVFWTIQTPFVTSWNPVVASGGSSPVRAQLVAIAGGTGRGGAFGSAARCGRWRRGCGPGHGTDSGGSTHATGRRPAFGAGKIVA